MSEATQYAKKKDVAPDWEFLSTGVEAKVIPIGVSLIDDVVASITDPKPPVWFNEEKQREEENPMDPAYLEELEATGRRRAVAAMETLLLFGLQLKELPADETWLPKLQYMAKRGHISLEGFDLSDPMDKELLYKKYVAVGTQDLIKIGQHAGLNRADVEAAANSFKS